MNWDLVRCRRDVEMAKKHSKSNSSAPRVDDLRTEGLFQVVERLQQMTKEWEAGRRANPKDRKVRKPTLRSVVEAVEAEKRWSVPGLRTIERILAEADTTGVRFVKHQGRPTLLSDAQEKAVCKELVSRSLTWSESVQFLRRSLGQRSRQGTILDDESVVERADEDQASAPSRPSGSHGLLCGILRRHQDIVAFSSPKAVIASFTSMSSRSRRCAGRPR